MGSQPAIDPIVHGCYRLAFFAATAVVLHLTGGELALPVIVLANSLFVVLCQVAKLVSDFSE